MQNKNGHERSKKSIIQPKFVIIPSKWFDNLPNTLIEAYSFGKPVIMPNHGSFKEFQTNPNLFDKDLNVSNMQWKFQIMIMRKHQLKLKEYLLSLFKAHI